MCVRNLHFYSPWNVSRVPKYTYSIKISNRWSLSRFYNRLFFIVSTISLAKNDPHCLISSSLAPFKLTPTLRRTYHKAMSLMWIAKLYEWHVVIESEIESADVEFLKKKKRMVWELYIFTGTVLSMINKHQGHTNRLTGKMWTYIFIFI
jgi:hypothetical protein